MTPPASPTGRPRRGSVSCASPKARCEAGGRPPSPRRWRVARLGNTEMNPTSTLVAVAFWLVLAGLTFGLLVWGYGSHFWH